MNIIYKMNQEVTNLPMDLSWWLSFMWVLSIKWRGPMVKTGTGNMAERASMASLSRESNVLMMMAEALEDRSVSVTMNLIMTSSGSVVLMKLGMSFKLAFFIIPDIQSIFVSRYPFVRQLQSVQLSLFNRFII